MSHHLLFSSVKKHHCCTWSSKGRLRSQTASGIWWPASPAGHGAPPVCHRQSCSKPWTCTGGSYKNRDIKHSGGPQGKLSLLIHSSTFLTAYLTYSCGQKFTRTRHGHERHGNFFPFELFLFFIQMIVQPTSLMTSKTTGNLNLIWLIWSNLYIHPEICGSMSLWWEVRINQMHLCRFPGFVAELTKPVKAVRET